MPNLITSIIIKFMIKGKKINLRMYNSVEELIEQSRKNSNLEERAITDHTEIYHENRAIKIFNENGFWSKESGTLLITDRDDTPVGSISFSRKDEFDLNMGYRIIKNEFRNRGYMSEALKLFSHYLFDTIPQITRLSIYTAENNVPSRKLATKCGFIQEGILRDAYFYRGDMHNWVVYSLLRSEYK